jgi:hypothetical protein
VTGQIAKSTQNLCKIRAQSGVKKVLKVVSKTRFFVLSKADLSGREDKRVILLVVSAPA